MVHQILIADKLAPEAASFLAGQPDVEVTTRTGLAGDDLDDALAAHEGVIVRSAVKLTGDVLDRALARPGARLRAVSRAGVGVDNIDLEAATRHGLAVMNSASASTITTAELAFALMMALARNIGPAYLTMHEGGWDRSRFVGVQLHGRTAGVVGLGRIGQTFARRALAFGMNVIGHDPFINADTVLDGAVPMLGSFGELIERVDIVSFHVPKSESTAGMLGADAFARARDGLLVVNAARGGIVDEAALLAALESGRCGGAALDVYPQEPPPADDPLRAHPRVLTTPHLGASTAEAQEAVAVDAARALLTYLRGEGLLGAVNIGGLDLDLTERQKDFVDLAGRMLLLLRSAAGDPAFHAVRFTVRGESLASRADSIARFGLAELLNAHLDQPVNVVNAAITAEQRGIEFETIIASDTGEDRLSVEMITPDGPCRVDGAIYADGQPRITHLRGYQLDMVPAGHMVLLTNADEPGRIGLVGQLFGDAGINIAEMVIGRTPGTHERGRVAMMILKVDEAPDEATLDALRAAPGILSATAVGLPR
jgi:D-3-phosphoglycerate dehydrogenase